MPARLQLQRVQELRQLKAPEQLRQAAPQRQALAWPHRKALPLVVELQPVDLLWVPNQAARRLELKPVPVLAGQLLPVVARPVVAQQAE